MSTMNISMPEAMRQYVETQAAAGNYSASEYVRHLIRKDEQSNRATIDAFFANNREDIAKLIAISEAELDAGLGIEWNRDKFLADGKKRRAKAKRK